MPQSETPKKPILLSAIGRYVLAVIVTAALATIASAQFVIAALSQAGAIVPITDRAAMSAADLISLAPLYAVFIGFALAMAFIAAGLISQKRPNLRLPLFIGAGAVAILVMLLAMERVFFGVPIIAGARTPLGLLTQVLCGAAGGYIFAKTRRAKPARETLLKDDVLPV